MKVIIFVNEFFGEWSTGRGGYGFIVRHLLPPALNIPNENITICMGRSKHWLKSDEHISPERIRLIKLPKWRYLAAKIVNSYDVIFSIEATVDYLFSLKKRIKKNIIFWIQDPRPESDWDEINTVNLAREPSYWNPKTYTLVKQCFELGVIKFVTQAKCLSEKAIELYDLPKDVNIEFLPNPVSIGYCGNDEKENNIIFLGRIDSVKRGWLFCEIAKRMPQYQFFVLGSSTSDTEKNKNSIIKSYSDVKNLHFLGHLEGKEKAEQLIKAKLLVNTSIHEALPVSFLEAFAYGVPVVSNQNPDNLVGKYGWYTGKILGDGWDGVDKFVDGITYLMTHEEERKSLAIKAKNYVESVHSIENFQKILKTVISNK